MAININIFEKLTMQEMSITQLCKDTISENDEMLASVAMASNNVSFVIAPANLLFYNEI